METVVAVIIAVLTTISIVGMFKGFNLRKFSTWFYIFCMFASGMLAGLSRGDIYGGLMLGAVFAALTVYSASVAHWQRRRAEKKADAWLARNEKNTSVSLITSMIRKLLHK